MKKQHRKRADKVRYWLNKTELPIPENAGNMEDQIIVSMIEKLVGDPSPASYNALMDVAYGKQATGDGAEVTHKEDESFNITFGTREE